MIRSPGVALALALLASPGRPGSHEDGLPRTGAVVVHGGGDFLVLGSDFPVRVVGSDAAWLRVEALDEARTDPRVVALEVRTGDLAPGRHDAAVRIEVVTREGREGLIVPVTACVGDVACPAPEPGAARLRLEDAAADVRAGLTPAGHLLLEIVDVERERREVGELRESFDREPRGPERPRHPDRAGAALETGFPLAFPWMCLEYPCGGSTAADVADATKGRDAIDAVSYERYTIRDGTWRQHPVGDPGPWARGAGLALWPMVTGGTEPSAAAVRDMWANRAAFADAMLAEARAHGYAGYCLDVEGRADAATRATFLSLVSHLADRLHLAGLRLMVATATWSTIAPFADLARTPVDYVASMDPYTSLWRSYVPANRADVEPSRLVWGFTWDRMPRDTQLAMWAWMEVSGYNEGVAGAAAWRTPLVPPHPGNDLDYYEAFRRYYPVARPR